MPMLLTGLSGNEIYCLAQLGYEPGNIVVGNSVHSLGLVRGITSGLKTLAGGEIRSVTQLIVDGRHAAINRLEQEAHSENDRGLTGVTSELRQIGTLMEFIAVGSAIDGGDKATNLVSGAREVRGEIFGDALADLKSWSNRKLGTKFGLAASRDAKLEQLQPAVQPVVVKQPEQKL